MKDSINERTTIPLTWAVIAACAVLGPVVAGSMWVKGVDDRLSRIEAKLHIETPEKVTVMEGTAQASVHAHED